MTEQNASSHPVPEKVSDIFDPQRWRMVEGCLLYTSDAADE